MATYIKKSTLDFPHLWQLLGMKKDNGERWFPSEETPEWVKEYLEGNFRSPSRAWPLSYAKPLLTQKFAKLLTEKDPELAKKCGVAE